MSLQNNCTPFHAVGALPVSGFLSEDALGLEAFCRVAFAVAKEKPRTDGE